MAAAILLTFICFSIGTYYDHLSQYGTSDQDVTLERINLFLADYNQAEIGSGSNLSNILVGLPGFCLQRVLNAHLQLQDHIVGGIYYTDPLPFTVVQVTIALLLIILCVWLLGKLAGWRLTADYFYHLVVLSVVLNLPMLKGLCKVLKYDCLSILLSATALLCYLLAVQRRSRRLFVLAVVTAALAYIEKDTSISALAFIVLAQTTATGLQAVSFRQLVLKLGMLYAGTLTVFLLTVFATVPRLWSHWGELALILNPIGGYGVSFDLRLVAILGFSIGVIFLSRKAIAQWARKLNKQWVQLGAFLILLALVVYAVLYQRNDIKWIPESGPKTDLTQQHIWVGRMIDRVALTTLDHGPGLTKLKYFLAEMRLLTYFLPEVVVLALLFLPFLAGKLRDTVDETSIVLFAGFCLLHLAAYAYLVVAIEAKYLSLVMFALVLVGALVLAGLIRHLDKKNKFAGSAAAVAVVICLITPACENRPAHFGYMNAFRNRKAEDIASIALDDYSFWTWVGWGETSSKLVEWAEQHSQGKNIAIAWDYRPPFHYSATVTMIEAQQLRSIPDATKMEAFVTELEEVRKVDYIIISKNTANRDLALNRLLMENRHKAVCVDRQGGIEFGWLFRPGDLLKR